MNFYTLHMTDHDLITNRFLIASAIVFLAIVTGLLVMEDLDMGFSKTGFEIWLVILILVVPLGILWFMRKAILTVKITVSKEGISTVRRELIPFDQVERYETKAEKKHHLISFHLKNGKRYSFSPARKRSTKAIEVYNSFVNECEGFLAI